MFAMESNNKPVRVLHVLTGLSSGGAESFIMNMYRNMDRDKVQFDFLLRSDENIYADELEKMGSKVYITASFPRHFIRNAMQTADFFRQNHYDIVHVHANALLYTYALTCAKRSGVKCRIIHSHNSAMAHMQLLPIHLLNKSRVHKLATDFFACSEYAGRWMFPGDFSIVHNAIDLAVFSYNPETRRQFRQELGIKNDELVIGHIGRFAAQKNHSFLIDVFAEIVKARPNARLVLLGDGDLRRTMEEKAESLNLADKIMFLGARKDVADIINVFDLFLFPSIYEGLALVMLEAQANGLPVICSDAIPDQAIFGNSVIKLPVEADARCWAEHAIDMNIQRLQLTDALRTAGYDINHEAKRLQEFYLSKVIDSTEM